MGSEEDLYSILGVEPGASADAIKAAYRILVREHHPDRKQLTPEDIAEAEARMAALNRAWEVLSDPGRRRLYDEQRHVDELLRRPPAASKTDREATFAAPARPPLRSSFDRRSPLEAPADASSAAASAGPDPQPRSTSALQASHLLRERILTTRNTFHWERDALEGFEWALTGRVFLTHYGAALRFEETLAPESTARFVRAARATLHAGKVKGKHALFLLLVERAHAFERVRSTLKEFSASDEGKGCSIVIVDAARSRSLLCSVPSADERLRSLLALLGV